MKLKTFQYILEYIPVWLVNQIMCSLPRSWTLRIGKGLGAVGALALPGRRRLVLKNLAMAFPEKSEDERQKIAKGVWKNLGQIVSEFVRASDINANNFKQYFNVANEDLLLSKLNRGRGLILIGFHFTNWELTGLIARIVTKNVVAIARPIKNPFVEKWVQQKRGDANMAIISHRDAVRGSLKVLKQKKTVGILIDQNLYTGGVFANFFGRPAATTTLPALLHLRTEVPVLICYCLRDGEKLNFIFEEPKIEENMEYSEQSILKITQTLNDHLEAIIRSHPENWFWVHNRWKRTPQLNESATN